MLRRRPVLAVGVVVVALVAVLLAVVLTQRLDDGPDCGGDPQARGAWTCTFADDFDGDRLDRRSWHVQRTPTSGYSIGDECMVDDPRTVRVAGGTLRLTVRRLPAPVDCTVGAQARSTDLVGASVSTYRRFGQTYGRFEIRARFPRVAVQGIHSALWMWPQHPEKYGTWPTSGEIDIAELYSRYPDRAIPYLHYTPSTPDQTVTDNGCVVDRPDRWHTYTLDWTPRAITISYDDEVCLVNRWQAAAPLTGRAPFDQDFMVLLTQGTGIGVNDYVDGRTPLPATMQVDHVRVWRRD